MKKYQIIYADPPWTYRNSENLAKVSCLSEKRHYHYAPMSLKDICNLGIGLKAYLDSDCLLFLWATGANLNEVFPVIGAWGFKFATVGFVWEKEDVNPGSYTMSSCEFCLIGKRGRIPKPRGARNIRQFLSEKRSMHSSKPEEIRNRITRMFPGQNKLELFARKPQILFEDKSFRGWDCIGYDISGKDIKQEIEELINA